MPPLVSVILPSYNHAAYLRRRIDSILNQTFTDFELIILDDCSSDGSRIILEGYASNSKISHLLFNEQNSGSTFFQWVKGINLSNGKYIWIAESDDFCDFNFLKVLVDRLEQDPSVSIAYCNTFQVDEKDNILNGLSDYYKEFQLGRWEDDFTNNGKDEIIRYLVSKNTIPNASAVLFRKKSISKSLKEIRDFRLSGDWLFWIMLLENGFIHYTIMTNNYFRCHPNTVRSSSAGTNIINHERRKILVYLLKKKIINYKLISHIVKKYEISKIYPYQERYIYLISRIRLPFRRLKDLAFRLTEKYKAQ